VTTHFDKIQPPMRNESEEQTFRWRYRVCELLNGIIKILAESIEVTPSGTITGTDSQTVTAQIITLLENHSTRHESGSADEMTLTGMIGLLATPQTPLPHGIRHENGGDDEIDVTGLSGELADPQPPKSHTQAFSTVTGTPTTLAGYGITDAAPSSEGVTGGNSHDHAGGDGAQIDHAGLSSLTTGDPHTQYQQESEKDAASGYAGLSASSRTIKGVDTTDDVIVDLATKGLVLKDTQGTPHYWRVTVSTLGSLTTTDIGTSKP